MDNLKMQYFERLSEVGERFCNLVDLVDSLSRRVFIYELVRVLTALYSAAVDLPDVELKGEFEKVSDDQDWWSKVNSEIGNKLGQFNFYYETFDPLKEESPVSTTLGDDIADIYSEIKRGLLLWETADPQKRMKAAWDWKLGFNVHWGNHLVDALRVLHRAITHYYEIENGMA